MFVKDISLNSGESEVIISDGENECYVFADSHQIQKGKKIDCPLMIFETSNVTKSKALEVSIQPQKSLSKYNYWIVARVIRLSHCEVCVGSLRMILNSGKLPGDIKENDIIEFAAERIDLF